MALIDDKNARIRWSKEAAIYGLAGLSMLFFSMMLAKSWEQIRATRIGVEELNHTINSYMSRVSVVEYKIEILLKDKSKRDSAMTDKITKDKF